MPQAPPYASGQPSLTDSLAALNIAPQSSYPTHQNTYAPTVPSYDQSFPVQTGPAHNPGTLIPSTSPQPPNYTPTGQPPIAAYGSGHSLPAYSGASSVVGAYVPNQQGMQSYEPNVGLSQGRTGVYDQYAQSRGYERPGFGQPQSFEQPYYEKPTSHGRGHNKDTYDFADGGFGEVFAYDGGNAEPYGARGTGSGSSWGIPESYNSASNGSLSSFADSGSSKLPKAVPKVEIEDKGNGVQKYRVKLLPDSSSSSGPMDVLCQIGLDGVRMISPNTGKTVRIYPLETITKWEVSESSVFTFWAKSAVDVEPRRIRLQSGSYNTNAILDTLTAACVQFSEMVGKDGPVDSNKASSDSGKASEQSSEKKKPIFADWMKFTNRQSAPEEKQHWVPDEAVTKCTACATDFGAFMRRAEVTQRLTNAKEISSKPPAPRSHEDLAKKLQEELERNAPRKSASSSNNISVKERSGQTTVLNCSACGSISLVNGSSTRCPSCGVDSSGIRNSGRESSSTAKASPRLWSNQSSSEGSGKRMREVACPTCTVHLQVQVPSSGTETVECGVCQHPFLVSAH